jgi:hypothetical protein
VTLSYPFYLINSTSHRSPLERFSLYKSKKQIVLFRNRITRSRSRSVACALHHGLLLRSPSYPRWCCTFVHHIANVMRSNVSCTNFKAFCFRRTASVLHGIVGAKCNALTTNVSFRVGRLSVSAAGKNVRDRDLSIGFR